MKDETGARLSDFSLVSFDNLSSDKFRTSLNSSIISISQVVSNNCKSFCLRNHIDKYSKKLKYEIIIFQEISLCNNYFVN